jgi:NAD(P)-dependent dehydrogenase (short-subunit alcohol dehydrogenase family)
MTGDRVTGERVALVTAASRGIGLATAQALIAEGYRVTITGRKEEPLRGAAAELGDPDRVLAVPGNAGDAEHRHAAVAATLQHFGSLDVLVNNAGINPGAGAMVGVDLDALRKILDVNVVGTLGWIQETHDQWMGEHGGSIVNVSSVAGLTPQPLLGAYGVSKAAVAHLTRQLAAELGPGIRVNAVAPAVVRTRFATPLFEGHEEAVAAAYPLGRIGEPQDVAQAIVFLASPRSSWITGRVLVLDGGLLSNGGMSTA